MIAFLGAFTVSTMVGWLSRYFQFHTVDRVTARSIHLQTEANALATRDLL